MIYYDNKSQDSNKYETNIIRIVHKCADSRAVVNGRFKVYMLHVCPPVIVVTVYCTCSVY